MAFKRVPLIDATHARGEGLKSFDEDRCRPYSINVLTLLGETQSGVNKHLETKVLDTGSMKDERLSRVGLSYHCGNMTPPYSISGVTNPPRES